MRGALIGLLSAMLLSACTQEPGQPAAAPAAQTSVASDVDFVLERKPQPGDPASAAIFDDALVLRVFGDDGSISEARIALEPGAPLPPGTAEVLRLSGDGWTVHPATVLESAKGGRNGLCAGGAPNFVLRLDGVPDGRRFIVGYRGESIVEAQAEFVCEVYGFRN